MTLVLARALHFGSGMMLAGVVAFRWAVLRPALGSVKAESDLPDRLLRRLTPIFLGSLASLAISELALFWTTAAVMSDSTLMNALAPKTLKAVLFQTHFGTVFQVRAVMMVALILLLRPLLKNSGRATRRNLATDLICDILAAALFVSNAWAGHAAAGTGESLPWRIGADALHLFIVAIWPTGLLFFNLFLTEARRRDSAANFETTRSIVLRFSQTSLFAVAALIVTGLANSYFLVGGLSPLLGTAYGHVLLVKLFIFLLILMIAAWNRWQLVPALISRETESRGPFFNKLRGFVLAEFGLAVAIILVVSLLGVTPPPR